MSGEQACRSDARTIRGGDNKWRRSHLRLSRQSEMTARSNWPERSTRERNFLIDIQSF
jgi:hypothetical protein